MEKKRVLMVLGMILLMVSLKFGEVESRALRSKEGEMNGCDHPPAAPEEEAGGGFGSFAAAANNSRGRTWKRSLAFRLASGPSRKGPGH
ncbi:PREDICTED: uncharacterized protein LOC109116964 [Tarenaya hassleriana]|uniref:uncharacterized protein LOC109116964 n=1 Tax=Tarenaya hassleriana TaxID=28532 RepID=UPI0008FD7F47|nr:PREDICTED: uncharacterized protein LOC109116964 [Tarenaya hassleriana]